MLQFRRLRIELLEDRRLLALAPLAAELPVGESLDGAQMTFSQCPAPAVAATNAGNSVAVWTNDGSGGSGIFARLLDRSGAALGGPFQVNTGAASPQKYAAVAVDHQGDFVVTWSSLHQDQSGYGVYARRFDAAGVARGEQFRVNTFTDGNQNFSAVAVDADGDFVITWTSQGQDGDGTGVFAQRYTADGTPAGDELRVNTTTAGNQRYSSVAMDAVGNFLVTWTGRDDSGSGIFARRFGIDGTPAGDEFPVNAITDGTQQLSAIAMIDGGSSVVAWQGYDAHSGTWNVYCRRFDSTGQADAEETLLGQGRYPSVTMAPAADFAVAWETYDPGRTDPSQVHVQHFDPLGGAWDVPLRVFSTLGYDQQSPSVAMAADRLTILWTGQVPGGPQVYALACQVTGNEALNLPPYPPVVTSILDGPISEGQTVSLTITAADRDGPPGSLTLSPGPNPPAGGRIVRVADPPDPGTAQFTFTWTPGDEHGPGVHHLVFLASDDGTPPLGGIATFTITVEEVNVAPRIEPIEPQTADEGQPLLLTPTVVDPDLPANRLSYRFLGNVPAGAAIDLDTGRITWTPNERQGPGTYQFAVEVTDDATPALGHAAYFSVGVEETNSAPVMGRIEDRTVDAGETLWLRAIAADADVPSQELTFSLAADAPPGAWIDPASGFFSWTPDPGQSSADYEVVVEVTDDASPPLGDQTTFSVHVDPAMLDSIADRTAAEGVPIDFTATPTGPYRTVDGLAFSLDAGAPDGALIDPQTGRFQWEPAEDQGNTAYAVTARLTDPATGLSDGETFTVAVKEVNRAAEFADVTELSVDEGETLSLMVAGDADEPRNRLSFSVQPAAPEGEVIGWPQIDRTTGLLTFTPTEAQGPGDYDLTVTVADDGVPPRRAAESFSIEIKETNRAPVIDPIRYQSVNHGDSFELVVPVSDPDEPAGVLSFRFDPDAPDPPDGAGIDDAGRLTWTPGAQQGPGEYPVAVIVTDAGGLSDKASFPINVETAMLAEPASGHTVREGNTLVVPMTVLPGAPSNLSFSLDRPAPQGAAVDPASGYFVWTPTEAQGPETHHFVVRATAGGQPAPTDTVCFSVTVEEVNRPPVFDPVPDQTVDEGQRLSFRPALTDPDIPASGLRFSLDPGLAEGAEIDPDTGLITWTPTETQGPGSYRVTVTVHEVTDDGTPALSDETIITINVEEVNRAPSIEPIRYQSVNHSDTFELIVPVSDPDDPAGELTFGLDPGAPQGVEIIDAATGQLAWTPNAQQGPGTYPVSVTVTDGGSPPLSDTRLFTITVETEMLAAIADRTVREGTLLEVPVGATHPSHPAAALTFSLAAGAPPGARLQQSASSAGEYNFTWTPTEADGPGSYEVTVIVTDDAQPQLRDTESFTIAVEEIDVPPTLEAIPHQTVDQGETLRVMPVVIDPDLPAVELLFSLEPGDADGAEINSKTGLFTWTPSEHQGAGEYENVRITVYDATTDSSRTRQFSITVESPLLDPIEEETVRQGETVIVVLTARHPHDPTRPLLIALNPDAANLPGEVARTGPTTAEYSWTTTVADAPGTYRVSVIATDDGMQLGDAESFTIIVEASNRAPAIAPVDVAIDPVSGQATVEVEEGQTVSVIVEASDPDGPAAGLSFGLGAGCPEGTAIEPAGGDPARARVTWTPAEQHGPGEHYVTVGVVDGGTPVLGDAVPVRIVVREVNRPPTFDPAETARQVVEVGQTLSLWMAATDGDVPPNALRFALAGGSPFPSARIVPTTGQFIWTPPQGCPPGTYEDAFRVIVADDGTPPLYDETTLSVRVEPSMLDPIADRSVAEGATLAFTATADESYQPTGGLTFSLDGEPPAGAAIDPATGRFTWSPAEDQGPGTYTITARLTDGSAADGHSDGETFTITVDEVNRAPYFDPDAIGPQTVAVDQTLSLSIQAADADVPQNVLSFGLEPGAPDGARLEQTDPITGLPTPTSARFTWTPTAAEQLGTYEVTVRVSDDGSPPLGETLTFSISVGGENLPPVPAAVGVQRIVEGHRLTVPISATDPDGPDDQLLFGLESAPQGPAGQGPRIELDPTAGWQFVWTPGEEHGPGRHQVTVRVTDGGLPAGSATATFSIMVAESNREPVLEVIDDRAVVRGQTLSLTVWATDADIPANRLTYALDGAPVGATLDGTDAALTWTPAGTQSPGEYELTVCVDDDDGAAPWDDRLTFTVTVLVSFVAAGLYDAAAGEFHLGDSAADPPAGGETVFRYGPVDSQFIPLVGDWDGDGIDTVGLYDPAGGVFHLKNSNLAGGVADVAFRFGPLGVGWQPLGGDFDGDGVDTVGLYDPGGGVFHLKNSNRRGQPDIAPFRFGPQDTDWWAIAGDFDGDGVATVGLYDPGGGGFHLKSSNRRGPPEMVPFRFGPRGHSGWRPLAGDWDGDGRDTVGLFDPGVAGFHLKNVNANPPSGTDAIFAYGLADPDWTPLSGRWSRQAHGKGTPAAVVPTSGGGDRPDADVGLALWDCRYDSAAASGRDRSRKDHASIVDLLILAGTWQADR